MRQEEKRQAKKDEETKGYGDYNWEELYKSGNLKKLKVAELNKYIFHNNFQGEKCPNQKNVTSCQFASAKVYVKGLDIKVLLKLQQRKTRTLSQKMMMSVSARTQNEDQFFEGPILKKNINSSYLKVRHVK